MVINHLINGMILQARTVRSLGASAFGGFFFGAMTEPPFSPGTPPVFLTRQTAGLYGSNGL